MLQDDIILSHENQIKELENKVRLYEELVNQLPHHFTYENPHIGLQIKKREHLILFNTYNKKIKSLPFSLLAIHYFYLNN